jgi:hypothetical protein
MMRLRQTWLAATGVTALVGVGLTIPGLGIDPVDPLGSQIGGLKLLAYWTTQSNLLVGITSLVLAINENSRSVGVRAAYLTGLAAIALTFVATHTILGDPPGAQSSMRIWVSLRLVHDIAPLLAVVGWLLLGPRNIFEWRLILVVVAYGLLYDGVTLIRGAYVNWYPYPSLDPRPNGYGAVFIRNAISWVQFAVFAAIFVAVDRWSQRRKVAQRAAV